MSEPAAHSIIGASSMHRWANCPGSVRLCKDIPPSSSSYADEGTDAHTLGANILLGIQPTKPAPSEMYDAVKVWVDLVNDIKAKHPDAVVLIEHRFDLSKVHPGLFGTADTVVYIPSLKLLHVIDYKHGAGIYVDVMENEQLMYYGLGALLSLGVAVSEVELVIVQPRCEFGDAVRRWRFNAIDLIDFRADLIAAAKRTEDPLAALAPGDWCRFCPAKAICPELSRRAQIAAKEEFSPTKAYSIERLGELLTWIPQLESWIKGVREFAYREAEHGRAAPGWKLVKKRATRKWINEDAVTKLAEKIDPELVERVVSPKSPAQMEKALSKEMFKNNFAHHVIAESSGLTLVPENDPREAVHLDAKSQFQNEAKVQNLLT
jgi:hypothetical protein